jgi:nucleotide-binding universal stress UspA family protein
MTFKNLLVHVDDDAGSPARLEAAIKLARDHDAHLTSLYVQADPSWPGYVRAQMPAEVMEIQERQLAEHAKGVEKRVVGVIEKSGLGVDHRTRRGSETAVAEIVALHARYADLAILGQDNPEETVGRELPAHVLLSSGRPAVVVPYIGAGKTLGQRVMVAWDAGREAARAVNDALPILERAQSVILLTVNPQDAPHGQEPGTDIALQLARHGVKVEVQHNVRGSGAGRHDSVAARRSQQRSSGHGRLRPFAPARAAPGRRHPADPGAHDRAGVHVPLIAAGRRRRLISGP